MTLPEFNAQGNLPEGVYEVTIEETVNRFGGASTQRGIVTERLKRILGLAVTTGKLESVLIFGSYVTSKLEPNDVDLILVMQDDFRPENAAGEVACLFDHGRAKIEFAADIFWIRPGLLILDTLDAFKRRWQLTREGQLRGIIEVKP